MSRRVARLGLLIAGLVIAALIAEILVRFVEPEKDTKALPIPDSERVYGYAPNSSGWAGGARFATNSWGFRGPEWEAAEDAIVVVALGDSYTFGYGVAFEDAYPSVLETRRNLREPARPVQVVNLGIPGYDTAQQIATLREFGPRVDPDVVLLGYVLNDICRHQVDAETECGDRLGCLYSLREDVHLLRLLLPHAARLARAAGADVKTTASREVDDYVGNGGRWVRNQDALLELRELCRNMDAKLAVIVLPYFVQFNDRHPARPAYQAAVKFFESHAIPVVNAYDDFAGTRAEDYWINAFDGHPDAAGHLVVAGAAEDVIEGLISSLETGDR